MGLERELEKVAKDTRDAVDEAGHRTVAGMERAKRDSDPGTMTEGERMRSALNETRHNVEAEVDKGKRAVRDNI